MPYPGSQLHLYLVKMNRVVVQSSTSLLVLVALFNEEKVEASPAQFLTGSARMLCEEALRTVTEVDGPVVHSAKRKKLLAESKLNEQAVQNRQYAE